MSSQPEYIKGLPHTALVVIPIIRSCNESDKQAVIIQTINTIHNEESSL